MFTCVLVSFRFLSGFFQVSFRFWGTSFKRATRPTLFKHFETVSKSIFIFADAPSTAAAPPAQPQEDEEEEEEQEEEEEEDQQEEAAAVPVAGGDGDEEDDGDDDDDDNDDYDPELDDRVQAALDRAKRLLEVNIFQVGHQAGHSSEHNF